MRELADLIHNTTMRRDFYRFVLFLMLSVVCASSDAQQGVKIGVITDIHFLDRQLAAEGRALSAYETSTGRNIADLHEVLDKVLADVANEGLDFLLVTGDITNHGERQSHLGIIEKLALLQDRGICVLVIPGNHDVNIPDSKAYLGDKFVPAQTISKEEFAELYGAFGYSDALKRDKASLSYLSEINESIWLLCIDSNRYGEHSTHSITGGRILPQTMDWILDVLHEAKKRGITVLGMMHHGLLTGVAGGGAGGTTGW